MRRHALAEHQKLAETQGLADLGTSLPADDDRLELSEIPFQLFGKLLKQLFADDEAQNRIAQKFEPLVGREPMIGPRRVRQRCLEELRIAELVPEPMFATLNS